MDHTAFWTIIPYAVAAVLTLFLKEVNIEREEKSKFKQNLIIAFKNRNIIILVISFALINEVVQVVGVFLNQSQYLRAGINIKSFGILAVVMQIVRLISIKAYKVSNRLGENRSIQILYSLVSISCIILVFTTNATLTIISIACLFGSASIVYPIILNVENKSIRTVNRATQLSIFAMFGNLTGAGVNIIIGKTADYSTPAAFLTCVMMCICAYILFIVYKKRSLNELNHLSL